MYIPVWKKPFLYLSGTDFQTISQCGPDEITRYSLLGTLVCIPSFMAFLSASYALSLVFSIQNYNFYIAVIWSFIIMTIDRCIIAHNPKPYEIEFQAKIKYKQARNLYLSRIVLSILLGFIIAEPLCVKIFGDEINEELKNEVNIKATMLYNHYDSLIQNDNKTIKYSYDEWRKQEDSANNEAKGIGGSKKPGTKQIYHALKNDADSLKQIYLITKANETKNIDSLKNQKKDSTNGIKKNQAIGLSGKINTLNKVAAVNPALEVSLWLLRLFFVVIELVPLILKNSLKDGNDAYVKICYQNNIAAVSFNEKEENNLTIKKVIMNLADENKILEQILKNKNIKRAHQDFKRYFDIEKKSAETYNNTLSEIEKIIKDEQIRKRTILNLTNAYLEYLSKIEDLNSFKSSHKE